jgi:uncharacterized membrane protein (UPF0127 family)
MANGAALAVSAVALLATASCGRGGNAEDGTDLHILDFDTATVSLVIRTDTVPLSLQLAVSEEQQRLGLMERRHLSERAGMLFVYASTQPPDAGFWMYRTRIPLDIAFLDSAGVIRSIRAAEPCETDIPSGCPNYTANTHFRFALELNAGVLQHLGADTGTRLLVGDLPSRQPAATR